MVHTKEKNFACTYCGKKFGLKYNMNVHERMHKGQGRKCKYCPRVFTQPLTLKNHLQQHQKKNHVVSDDAKVREAQKIVGARGRPSVQQMVESEDEN